MSLLPARRTRRAVLLVTTALVATLLPTLPLAATAVAAPVVPAAVLLPAPGVAPTTITAGTVATVTGTRCVPKQFTRVYVSLSTAAGDLVTSTSVTPATDGTWTAHVTPSVTSAAGAYSVSATCDRYGAQAAYRSRAVSVTASSAAPWTGQAPSLPNVPNGALQDVDCASAVSCVAVGNVGIGGASAPLAETWDGLAWTVTPIPSSVAGDVYLFAVDCPTTTRCVAVGDIGTRTGHESFTAILAGTTWTSRILDPPPGEREGSLTDVSCPTATTCLAIGSTGSLSEGSRFRPTSYRLQGTTWTQLPDPVAVSQQSGLNALSCVTVRTCVAVGTDNRTYPVRPTAQVFDGTVWNTMSLAPLDLNTSPYLFDISCATISSCVTVGSSDGSNGVVQPLVQVLTNTTWRRAAVAVDPAVGGGLRSVSCVASNRCTAVGSTGQYQDTSPNRPVAATLAGGSWTSTVVDVPAGANASRLAGVSCVGSTCVAVGDVRNVPLAAVSSGTGWADAGAVAADGYVGGEFDAVDCSAPNACTAGGWSYAPDRETATPLVNRWNGTTWTRQVLPVVGDARIAGVACPSSKVCFAVGAIGSPNGDQQPLLLQWRGGVWKQVKVRLPRGGTAVLDAVSCSSTTSCLAVGQSRQYGGDPVAVALSGTTWSATPTPDVGGLQYVGLTGVSCVAQICRVVGHGSDDETFTTVGIDLMWDGSAFSTGSPVDPADAVDCAGPSDCVAVGGFSDDETSASVLVGNGWTREALPDPSGTSANVNGVSCNAPPAVARSASTLSCVAVGSSTGGAFVAARTSAGAWSAKPVVPLVPGYQQLEGVSCTSEAQCVAVGHDGGPTIVVSPTG